MSRKLLKKSRISVYQLHAFKVKYLWITNLCIWHLNLWRKQRISCAILNASCKMAKKVICLSKLLLGTEILPLTSKNKYRVRHGFYVCKVLRIMEYGMVGLSLSVTCL